MTQFAENEAQLREQIAQAQGLLGQVVLSDELLDMIAEICIAYAVDGMRADLVIHRTARTLAAWEGVAEVTAVHVQQAALLALPHRQRRQPFDQSGFDDSQLNDIVEQQQQKPDREPQSDSDTEDD